MHLSDEEIIRLIKQNNDQALAFIYRKHFSMISHFVENNSGDYDDARDIFQEGIIAFYELVKKDGFFLSSQIKTLLYSICRRIWLKKLVYKSRFIGRINDFEELISLDEDFIKEEDNKEAELNTMKESLEKLGDPCTSLLKQFYFEKKSMEDLTIAFGYNNTDTAKNQKYKCLTRLKKIFIGTLNR